MKRLRFCCLGLGVLLAGPVLAENCQLKQYGSLPVEMIGNRATTAVKINGTDTRFILDTGAFFNTMSKANAAALRLELRSVPYGFRIQGVGGTVDVQQTHVKQFGILGTTFENVAFIVGGTDTGRGMLGANLLDIADLDIDLAHGKTTLLDASGCGKSPLAYWAKDGQYNVADIESPKEKDRRTFIKVRINGKKIRALLDSGAPATVLDRHAAEKAGIDLNAPTVKIAGRSGGVGEKSYKTWTVQVDSLSVGTETIQHTQMQVIDGELGDDTDMLLGVDFLLAHHILIANSTKKAYFTYNGGRVFTYATAPSDSNHTDTSASHGAADDEPKTAEDYFLRGQSHLARGEFNASLADMNDAIRMAPDQAVYYVSRAKVYETAHQPAAELADLDKALTLSPMNVNALMMRADYRLSQHDRAGAIADVALAKARAPSGSVLQRSIANFYIRVDQPDRALPLLDDWIRLHDNDVALAEALGARCWARALSNQMLDDALKDCQQAIKRDGERPLYLDGLGLVELRLGNYPESVKAYEKLLAQRPQSAWVRYSLGLARYRNGQTDAGNADLTAARASDPHVETRAAFFGMRPSS